MAASNIPVPNTSEKLQTWENTIGADDVHAEAVVLVNSSGAELTSVPITGSLTSVVPGTGATNLGKAEDAVHASGDTGVMALAVRNESFASYGADGDYCPIAVNRWGNVYVTNNGGDPLVVASHAVTNAGTFAVQVSSAIPAGTNNIGDVDVLSIVPGTAATNLGKAIDAAAGATDTGVAPLAIRDDALSTLTPVEGDYAPLRVDAQGALWVMHDGNVTINAIPAGTNNIGDVDVLTLPALPAGNNNIGDVDVASIVPGTGATNLGKAEDAAHTTGDVGVMALAVRNDSLTTIAGTNGDYAPLSLSANGALWVALSASVTVNGGVAHDAAFAGSGYNPIVEGAVASTAVPAAVSADGDVTQLWASRIGGLNTHIRDLAGDSCMDETNNSLKVSIVSGAGGGGTSAADDADFTAGTTAGTPAMGVFESSPTSVTDGDLGVVGITATRALKVQAQANSGVDIGDVDVLTLPSIPAGNNNIGDVDIASIAAGDNNIGNVDVLTLPSIPAGTNNIGDVDVLSVVPGTAATNLGKAEDAAHASGDVGVMMLAVRQDSQTGLAADGDYLPPTIDAAGGLRVSIVAGAGSGGTASADDADFTAGTTQGTPSMGVYESSPTSVTDGDIGMVGITQTRAMKVHVVNGGGGASSTDDAAFTAATDAGTPIMGFVTADAVDSGDVGVVAMTTARALHVAVQGAIPAGTNNIGDVDVLTLPSIPAGTNNIGDVDVLTVPADPFGVNADAASATGSISAKLRFIASTGIPITGTVTVGSHAVTNAGTFVVQENGAALTALQLIDDVVYTDDTSTHATGTSKGVGIMAAAAPTDASVNANDIGMVAMTTDRKLHVAVMDALPAGNNNIGDVDVASVIPGTGATNQGKAVDSAAGATDTGIAALAVRDDTLGTLTPVDNDYTHLRTNNRGALWVIPDGNITVVGTGTLATQVDGAALTALQLIDDPVVTLGTTTYTEATTKAMVAGAIRRDADTTAVNTDNEAAPLLVDARGALKVECFSGETLPVSLASVPSHAVTNAGTFAVQDSEKVADDAAFTAGTTKVQPVGFFADETATDSVDEGDVGASRMTLDRKQIVTPYAHAGAGGGSSYSTISTAAVLSAEIKGSAGKVFSIQVFNLNAAARHVRLYNQTGAPGSGDTANVVWRGIVPGNTAGAGFVVQFPMGKQFATGIGIRASTGIADNDTGALAANELTFNVDYI